MFAAVTVIFAMSCRDMHLSREYLHTFVMSLFHETELFSSQSRVATGEVAIERAKESFRIIAKHGAVCFDTTRSLREINSLYQTSFSQFLDLFDSATSHSDR